MTNSHSSEQQEDGAAAAKAAALRYVSDATAGISRHRAGRGFVYRGPDGLTVRDRTTLDRIRALAIPPAWTNVWICPTATGHIQATGRDARGRKQYRYHARWRAVRDETKYARLAAFAKALPRIRRRVGADLRLPGLPRAKVLAIIVRLMERTLIRVGNESYARENGSYGLTTMRNRHVRVDGKRIMLRFRGKGGKAHAVDIDDKRLARLVRDCRGLPGQHLFQYIDDAGDPQPVSSDDVNDYLREISGDEFTAKDFRTWGGTLVAAALIAEAPASSSRVAKAAEVAAVAHVAAALGNTVAVCRKSYIHPLVLQTFLDPAAYQQWEFAAARAAVVRSLRSDERRLLRFLTRAERTMRARRRA